MLGLAAVFVSVACDGDEIAPPEPETITSSFATGGSCGDYRRPGGQRVKVEVVRGTVPCPAAKRVLKRHYNGGDNGRWNCVGPGPLVVECAKSPSMAIRGRLDTWGPGSAVDGEAAVRFSLAGRVLTVRLLASAPGKTRRRVSGARIRASCGKGFAQLRPDSEVRQTRTRLWPAGRARMRYRFHRDISLIATWCRLEDPKVGHVAFVRIDP